MCYLVYSCGRVGKVCETKVTEVGKRMTQFGSPALGRRVLGRRVLGQRVILIAMAIGCVVACASPTLPLPPPSIPRISRTDSTHVTLSSTEGVEANAIVVIYNQNPAVSLEQRVSGVQADGKGSWTQTIVATTGDVVDVTQEFGTTQSPPTTIQIQQ